MPQDQLIAFLETLPSCSNSRNAKAIALAWQDVGNITIIDELEHVTNIRHSSRYQQGSIFPGQTMSKRWLNKSSSSASGGTKTRARIKWPNMAKIKIAKSTQILCAKHHFLHYLSHKRSLMMYDKYFIISI